jgi:LmbE family N-acetylglucosaminyl deacetylase
MDEPMKYAALVLAPHADDEVLGMGGTIARLVSKGHRVVVAVLTGHGSQPHPLWPASHWDVIRQECRTACDILGVHELIFGDLPAACLDVTPAWKINAAVNVIVQQVQPKELYVPFGFDLHKDHGAIAYAASVAARPYTAVARSITRVLAYETLSETHLAAPYLAPPFQPNVFVDITETVERKILAMQAYKSQLQEGNMPRSIGALRSLAHLRGTHIGCPAAEAFVLLGEYVR